MRKKIAVIAAVVALSLTVAGCHRSNHRYSGSVGYGSGVYDDWGYGGYGWEAYPFYSLSISSSRGSHRHGHRGHHRGGGHRRR